MSAKIHSLKTRKTHLAEAEVTRLGDRAVQLRKELLCACAEHAVKCLEAEGIDLGGIDDTELATFKATNAIVWLEEEAKRIRGQVTCLENELTERGVPRLLDARLKKARG